MRKKRVIQGWLLAAPIVLGTVIFFILPFCIAVKYSITYGVGGDDFVGLENYIKVYASETFRLAVLNTFRFIGTGVGLITVISLGAAMILQKKIAGAGLIQSATLFAMVIPVGASVMFLKLFLANNGMLNNLMGLFHMESREWLTSPYAFWILVLIFIWKNCGYNILMMMAGLTMIPKELYQSASLDGAGKWSAFIYITLPMMLPTILLTVIISVTNSFKTYREAFLLGGKRPDSSIYMLQHFLNNNFENLNYQRLSVAAVSTFVTVFSLTAVFCIAVKLYGGNRSER